VYWRSMPRGLSCSPACVPRRPACRFGDPSTRPSPILPLALCLLSHSLPVPKRVRHGKQAELPTAARFFLFLHPDSPSSARPKPAPPSPPPLPRCRAQLCPPWTPAKPKLGPPPHEHAAWPLRPAMARAEPSRGPLWPPGFARLVLAARRAP